MNKKIIIIFSCCIFAIACKKDQVEQPVTADKLLTTETINRTLYTEIEKNGVYNWSSADDQLFWSAGMQSDSIFAVGYKPSGVNNVDNNMHTITIESSEWVAARDEILNMVLAEEQKQDPTKTIADLLPFGYPKTLPTMALYLTSYEAAIKLRNLSTVRYIEPMGYELPPLSIGQSTDRSSSGCSSAPNYGINTSDYTTIAPGAKQSWHHASSNISAAWSLTTGEDVTVVIIDTGISDDQENLNANFNSGYSSGRTVEQLSTYHTGRWWWRKLDTPNDKCGHGTQMSGLVAAPRSTNGNATGIAYNSNLIGIRAVEDVFISSSNEKEGVKDALIIAGNRSDVKVISMSIGTPLSSGTVADGINYAYGNGKSIFAAAGTSFSWTAGFGVIFPATMDQTIAVTGVKESETEKCDVCHEGSKVDFTMVMERSADEDRHGITNAINGTQPEYVGGSSCATASVAGIAVLVYANNPGITRDEVYDLLKENATNYPTRDSDLGWGTIDANAAIED